MSVDISPKPTRRTSPRPIDLLPELLAGQPLINTIEVRGNNLVEVVRLATFWTQRHRAVTLIFPTFASEPPVGDATDPEPFGLTAAQCYDRRGHACWCPSLRFIEEVMGFFADNPLVSCDQSKS